MLVLGIPGMRNGSLESSVVIPILDPATARVADVALLEVGAGVLFDRWR
jgi:hypothetical protein